MRLILINMKNTLPASIFSVDIFQPEVVFILVLRNPITLKAIFHNLTFRLYFFHLLFRVWHITF